MLENPYGLPASPRFTSSMTGERFTHLSTDQMGRVLSPGRARTSSTMIGSLPISPAVTGLPAGYSGSMSASGVQEALAMGPIRGEVRTQYVPYERKYIDYESVERVEKVPVERTVIDYQEMKKVDYVPRQRTITDYYAVEHQVNYIPRTIPETKIEYVPVQTVTERIEYVPVERQVVHYPDDYQLGRQSQGQGTIIAGPTGPTNMSTAMLTGRTGASTKPLISNFQQNNRSISSVSPLQIESGFAAESNVGMLHLQQPANHQSYGASTKYSALSSTQHDSYGSNQPSAFKEGHNQQAPQKQQNRSNYRALPKISEARSMEGEHENMLDSLEGMDSDISKGFKTFQREIKQQQDQFETKFNQQQKAPTPPSTKFVQPTPPVTSPPVFTPSTNEGQPRPNSAYNPNPVVQTGKKPGGIRLTLSKDSGRSTSQTTRLT